WAASRVCRASHRDRHGRRGLSPLGRGGEVQRKSRQDDGRRNQARGPAGQAPHAAPHLSELLDLECRHSDADVPVVGDLAPLRLDRSVFCACLLDTPRDGFDEEDRPPLQPLPRGGGDGEAVQRLLREGAGLRKKYDGRGQWRMNWRQATVEGSNFDRQAARGKGKGVRAKGFNVF
ncbi:hypothetical protein THAOC_36508, partial [Thalassiosira oceanica]